jgi:hypothetical protein
MDDLSIYIPTYQRPARQRTLELLCGVLAERTFLVVQPQEEADYRTWNPGANIVVLPEREDGWNLPKTRQWIQENAETRYVIQMDDDLDFHFRPYQYLDAPPEGEPHTRLKPCGPKQVKEMLNEVLGFLEHGGFAHVGVSAREGNVHTKDPIAHNTRMMRFLAQDRTVLEGLGLRWDVVEDYEDFNMTLGLLVRGLRNVVLFEYAQGQPGSNTEGGCSVYRNDEFHTRAAQHLAARFPGFVKVVRKDANNWRGMTERTDVRVSWKKAAERGQVPEPWAEGPAHWEFSPLAEALGEEG